MEKTIKIITIIVNPPVCVDKSIVGMGQGSIPWTDNIGSIFVSAALPTPHMS